MAVKRGKRKRRDRPRSRSKGSVAARIKGEEDYIYKHFSKIERDKKLLVLYSFIFDKCYCSFELC
jgi:hypothetical protein